MCRHGKYPIPQESKISGAVLPASPRGRRSGIFEACGVFSSDVSLLRGYVSEQE
jgi:hypothetical protein